MTSQQVSDVDVLGEEDGLIGPGSEVELGGAPRPIELDESDPLTPLRRGVIEALQALPTQFSSSTSIEGVNATDLHAANTLLGASIEVQVVTALNKLRDLWDPSLMWQGYRFERQSQTFPDVRLVRKSDNHVALGIELKGWYLLSKEAAPTFRFKNTPASCAPHDLICVVPWHFANVTSGVPVVRDPWIVSAKWAAEYRNYWWTNVKGFKNGQSSGITIPQGVSPYPTKDQQTLDVPDSDVSNFGRLARVAGLMNKFIREAKQQEALGIPIRDWVAFFVLHSDNADVDEIFSRLETDLKRHMKVLSAEGAASIVDAVRSIHLTLEGQSHEA